MIATPGHRHARRWCAGLCPILVLLAASPRAQAGCTEKTISEFATATSREAAERNATARLNQKLKRLGGNASWSASAPQVECKQPLMWQCTVSVKICN